MKNFLSRNWRVVAFAFVTLCFFIQTFFVYSDFKNPKETITLSADAAHGQSIWLRENCQSCHQIHGFGGFLGPDLTNISERIGREGFNQILIDIMNEH